MSRLLYGTALQEAVHRAAQSSERVHLVSGFIKSGFLQKIGVREKLDLQVFSRWRLSDLVSGGSDVAAARETLSIGGSFHIHPRLHAKVFLFDDVAFIGSANLTSSGLPRVEGTGNLEAAIVTSETKQVEKFVELLLKSSTKLCFNVLDDISEEIEIARQDNFIFANESASQMPATLERHVEASKKRSFTQADFPWCENPSQVALGIPSSPAVEHDLELFSLSPNPCEDELKSAFLQSRCYVWLVEQTQETIQLGKLRERLHNALNKEPKVYRRDVSRLLNNLLTWALEFDPGSFTETRFRHTTSYRSTDQNNRN